MRRIGASWLWDDDAQIHRCSPYEMTMWFPSAPPPGYDGLHRCKTTAITNIPFPGTITLFTLGKSERGMAVCTGEGSHDHTPVVWRPMWGACARRDRHLCCPPFAHTQLNGRFFTTNTTNFSLRTLPLKASGVKHVRHLTYKVPLYETTAAISRHKCYKKQNDAFSLSVPPFEICFNPQLIIFI